ncbi:hypothetical protein K435DRAFT_875218 [Dendrothele bispora CBS 962.96]|uniref:Uncharacterized protein n=1 Tax=Dendrothele bispora (strain CBS 962.96) TaxID=1314807 RepID=A0A4S8KVY0_DENBC|nr:hypothetical protein K435DRAFT_875218 [Dendrothele bispora CBS 962.96]
MSSTWTRTKDSCEEFTPSKDGFTTAPYYRVERGSSFYFDYQKGSVAKTEGGSPGFEPGTISWRSTLETGH